MNDQNAPSDSNSSSKKLSPFLILKTFALIILSVIFFIFWTQQKQSIKKLDTNIAKLNVNLDELDKWNIYYFWASWCTSCKEDLIELNDLLKSNEVRNLKVTAVNLDSDKDHQKALEIWSPLKLSYPLIFESKSNIMKDFKLEGLPTSFLLNKEGKVVYRFEGKIDWLDEKFQARVFK